MGGTSTDVAHYSGIIEKEFETEIAGIRMRVPMLKINTVAAGGGSILHFDGEALSSRPSLLGQIQGPPVMIWVVHLQ